MAGSSRESNKISRFWQVNWKTSICTLHTSPCVCALPPHCLCLRLPCEGWCINSLRLGFMFMMLTCLQTYLLSPAYLLHAHSIASISLQCTFAGLLVEFVSEVSHGDFVVREFLVAKKKTVYQYHFITWPDHGVPESTVATMQMLQMARGSRTDAGGPMVVHCSAGVGRTGTLIAIDCNLDKMKAEGTVDVQKALNTMRRQRTTMVQTEAQYIFIYLSLLQEAPRFLTDAGYIKVRAVTVIGAPVKLHYTVSILTAACLVSTRSAAFPVSTRSAACPVSTGSAACISTSLVALSPSKRCSVLYIPCLLAKCTALALERNPIESVG